MLKFNENSLQSDGFLVHHYEAIPSKCPPLARLLQSSTPCQFYKSWLASFPQPFKVSTFSLRALLPATLPGVVSLDVLSMACEQDAAVLWLLSLIYAPPYVDGAAESRRQNVSQVVACPLLRLHLQHARGRRGTVVLFWSCRRQEIIDLHL